jgi:endonuclease/exonuclease/phosphatase (EEP) superfamily protein YafD
MITPEPSARQVRRVRARAVLLVLLPGLASCVSLTTLPRAVVMDADRTVQVRSLPCSTIASAPKVTVRATGALDPRAIRVLTWNIHKQEDPGWRNDLADFARASDVVLLQEATLNDALQETLDAARLSWVMASSFLFGDLDVGVLTAARAAPVASCTERVVEPLLRIPKSTLVSWFALDGATETLAVVNVHAINFSMTLGAYRAQFVALTEALRAHDGPIVFAGDLNTWNDARRDAVAETAAALRLVEVPLPDDRRALFLGRQVDHVLIRGLEVVEATAIPVTSSDHNPVLATLRLRSDAR